MANNTKKVALTNTFFAFWGMVLAAAALLLGGIFAAIGLGIIVNIVNLIGQIAIAIAVVPAAWRHIANKSIAWKIIFFVALIAYIVGCVLGLVG